LKLNAIYEGLKAAVVLEKNPPKQGLKQEDKRKGMDELLVLEKNPPKQGLKQVIESCARCFYYVLEKNPPKQGLKLASSVYQFLIQIKF